MFSLEGKIALVTGGGRNIGRQICLALAEAGASLAIVDVLSTSAENTVEKSRAFGVECQAFETDVTNVEQVKTLVEEVEMDMRGKVGILVNNAASLKEEAALEETSDEKWQEDLNVNLTGAYNMIKAFFPRMKELGWGRIINITGFSGLVGHAKYAGHAASKAGLLGLTLNAAIEGGPHDITANCIAPGVIGTKHYYLLDEEERHAMESQTVVGHAGQERDIATAVVFLASEEAKYITGVTLPVTGGMGLFRY